MPTSDDDAPSATDPWDDDASPYGSVVELDALPHSGDGGHVAPTPRAGDHPFDAVERARYLGGQVVARGGMGQISAVTDARLRRQVALKRATSANEVGAGLERRLAQEAWITAQLEHPGIVPVYDAGRDPDGRPFFTMRLIRGRSLATALTDGDLDESTLLRHFLAVCQAMAFAHAMGVVHRDLKPANIMLGEFGETQIVDWGLARGVDAADEVAGGAVDDLVPDGLAARTMVGARVGTPAYMSPEQAHAGRLGRASDVWSLGAILFEIVTGRPPHGGLSTAEIFGRLARGPVPRVEDVRPDAPPELAAVVAHALRLAPEDRYADAKHLADDVAAYLDGRRVRAFDYSAWDLVKRFGSAFRVPLLIAALAAVTIGVVFAVSYSQTRSERDRAQAAERAATSARDRAVAAEHVSAEALADADRSFSALLVRSAQEAVRHDARAEAEVLAAHALLRGPSPEARGVLARWGNVARPAVVSAEEAPECAQAHLSPAADHLLCVERDALSYWAVAPLELQWRVPRQVDEVAFVSDREALVTGPPWRFVGRLDLELGVAASLDMPIAVRRALSAAGTTLVDCSDQLLVIRGDQLRWFAGPIRMPRAISGDGRVGIVYEEPELRAYRLDLDRGAATPLPALPLPPGRGPMSFALDHAGQRAAVGSTEGDLTVIDTTDATLRWTRSITDRSLSHVLWSPDDRWIAVRDERGWPSLLDADGRVRLALPRLRVSALAWRGGALGQELVLLGDEVRIYRVPDAAEATRYPASAGASTLALSADGARLALPDGDGTVRVYDVASGARLAELPGDGRAVAKSAVFLGGRDTLAISWPGRFQFGIWPMNDRPLVLAPAREIGYRRLAATADGGVLTASYGHQISHLRGDGSLIASHSPADGGIGVDVVTSGDGQVGAWLSNRGLVEVARLDTGDLSGARPLTQARDVSRLALDGAGRRLALAAPDRIRVLDVATEQIVRTVAGGRAIDVALSRDGDWLAAGMVDGSVWVWGPSGDAPKMIGAGHLERVSGVAFSPGGDGVVTAGWDGVALRWDLRALDADPRALVDDLERTWGIGLGHATQADLR